MSTYQQTTLANGLTVASEYMPSVESASVGVYIRTGSRAETEQNNGVAHFLEHMAFKGTNRRSAEDIAREIEDVGGHMNAYTSKETTAYHLKVLKEDVPLAVDMLADILQNSTFLAEEVEKERHVILSEISQTHDEPDEVMFENLHALNYPNHPLGRSILGTVETVQNMDVETLKNFMKTHYNANNMVLAAVGNVKHEDLVKIAEENFTQLCTKLQSVYEAPTYNGGEVHTHKDLEQIQVAISYKGIAATHKLYYAANIFTSLLGGGMSSRLFQEVREQRGLAYSIYSYLSNQSDCGTFGIYAGCAPKDYAEMMNVIENVIENTKNDITEDEVNRAKAQLCASIRMAQESTDARMGRIAKNIFVYERFIPLEEVVEAVNSVTLEDVIEAGKTLTDKNTRAVSTIGLKLD